MRKRIFVCLAAGACLATAGVALAQEKSGPPKVLVITREVVKPGKGTAHEKWETGWPAAFTKAKWPVHFLAMTSMTGESRALFLAGYDSLADWEKDIKAQEQNEALYASEEMLGAREGEFLTESRNAVALYQPELSYHADVKLGEMRYFVIFAVHVKPGHDKHFEEVRKIARAAHEKANLGDHYAVYHVTSGAPGGLYLIILPMKSLSELDNFPTVHGKAYQDALGEEGQKKLDEFTTHGQESSESNIFAFSPKMSYVSKETVDSAPDFWAPKPKAKAAVTEKQAEKQPEKKAEKKAEKKP
jgi:hypothetical protein